MENIEYNATIIFNQLKEKNFYFRLNTKNTLMYLVELFGDLNTLHPYREGNGRTQRLFIKIIAKVNGIYLDFSTIKQSEMIEASYQSILGNNTLLEIIFKNNYYELSLPVQIQCIEQNINKAHIKDKIYSIIESEFFF